MDNAGRLLDLVRDVVVELHPHRRTTLRVKLSSSLDRDLGIDSLGRAELLSRVEREFQVTLPEDLLAQAETPNDLLTAVLEARGGNGRVRTAEFRRLAPEPAEAAPARARTLPEVLDWHDQQHPGRTHILLRQDRDGEEIPITYRDLVEGARSVAAGLVERSVSVGDRVAIMLPTGIEFFHAFFGILYAGAVPVPIYPPARLSQIQEHLRRQAAILNNAEAVILITVPEGRALAALLKAHVGSLRTVETVNGLRAAGERDLPAAHQPQSTALLQYTSGSTGEPKGVVLTHANLLANIRAIGRAIEAGSSDVLVSWLPLYHDMGLIGAWLGSLYFAAPAVIMSPLAFLARPQQWLWAIHHHRATISAAPNFAFEICVRKLEDRDLEGLDLSSLRVLMNGAEPVVPRTVRRFTERFSKYGLRPEALTPVYGMAENSVGLTFPPPGRGPVIDRVQRGPLTTQGRALAAAQDDADALEFVACGRPLQAHQVRIVDSRGAELGERREGRLEFRGPSATSGYFRNEEDTRRLFHGDWLDSGDLAYMAGGDVFLTGRSKDIIIRAGRNIYPHEVEAAVGDVAGVRKGCVAVFGSHDRDSGTERIVIVAETREEEQSAREALRARIEEVTTELLETPPDDIVLGPPQTVPKTSSGKVRRAAARELYESGRLGGGRRAVWWQLTRLTASGLWLRARRGISTTFEVIYGGYCLLVFGVMAALTWLSIAVLPSSRWRWAVGRRLARLALGLTAHSLRTEGLKNLPAKGGIVVSNHASYLDGLALTIALPGELMFVVKNEMQGHWFAGPLLRRVGSLFVERIDPAGGVGDFRQALHGARAGRRLVFFPEGTFTRAPGLLDFRLGAFSVAAKAGVPVVPVALAGTRSILRDEQWLPRRGVIRVEVGEPLYPEGADFGATIKLRDSARRWILNRCGEPDLARERVVFSNSGIERVDLDDA